MSSDQLTPTLEKVVPQLAPKPGRAKVWFLSLLIGLIAGLVASLVSVVCMLALRLGAGVPTPVELFGDFALKRLSTGPFIALLMRFAPNPKTEPLGLALLAMIGLGTLLSVLYVLLVHLRVPVNSRRPARREWLVMLSLGLVMSIAGSALFWVELRQNFLGLPVDWARLVSALALLLDFELYAIVLGWCYRALLPRTARAGETKTAQSRRALLARTGVAVLGVGSAAGSLGMVRGFLNNYASYDGMKYYPPGDITPPITPNDEHYVVTQNPVDPTPSINVWRLDVTGLVGASGTYTYEEFTSLPSVSRAITLECIANGLGDHLISTAIWQGVALRSLLEKHGGAQANARYVAFYSVDGYTVSQPLDEVLAVDTLLAFRMNGAELPMRHGYPLRVLIPGRYGEENPKWLTRIELTDHFVSGLYADQGWYNGPLHTITRIDQPRGDVAFASVVKVSGLAFAGNRGIQRVEVSTDGGTSWSDAQLAPPLSQDSWVLWTYQWHPATRGRYTLVARSTDGTGQVQTSQKQITVPNGATGYHIVSVTLN